MRLMHVMAGAKEGGAENIMLESVLALAELDGVEQRVVTRPDNRHRIEEFEKAGITVDTASFDNLWRLPTDQVLKRAIKDFQPDLIEYWMGRAGTYAPRRSTRRMEAPVRRARRKSAMKKVALSSLQPRMSA